jgi:deoxyribonuclease-4
MIRFGPAGNSQSFYDAGYNATVQAFAWIQSMGLTAYEYSFGRGVSLGEDTATAIGEEAAAHGVALSAHAPYYINLANTDSEKREKALAISFQPRACCL